MISKTAIRKIEFEAGNNAYMRIYVYYVISIVPDFVYLFVFIMQPQIS